MAKKKKTNQLEQCTLYVEGMHCSSCEILIEKKLLKKEGIESVDASLTDGETTVHFQSGKKPDLKEINKEFKELGYNFAFRPFNKAKPLPLVGFTKDGVLTVNTNKWKSLLVNSGLVLFLILGFKLLEKNGLGSLFNAQSSNSVGSFFLLGLIAGSSSCAALVGGLLLSMTKQWNEVYIDSTSFKKKLQPHLMFHIGRILAFSLFGGLIGFFSSYIADDFLQKNNVFLSIIVITASLIMFYMAMQMYGFRCAQKWAIKLPKSVTGFVANEENFKGKLMPLLVGALTFLLPCAVTISVFTTLLTSGSFINGFSTMLAFVLGTFIPLALLSLTGVKLNSKPHLTAKFNKVGAVLVMFFVIYNINGQLNSLGLPSLSDIKFSSATSSNQAIKYVETDEAGTQILNVTATGFSYTSNGSTYLKPGVPAKLKVQNNGISGCGAYMQAAGLFSGYVELKAGLNEVSFTPQKGTYKLTCTMGMVPPITITVI
ncbi:MAG: hypothetical protein Fur003_3980 [Candidatus Dojkabacteria bacterium]